jgi:SAM-dependent methyltransferase
MPCFGDSASECQFVSLGDFIDRSGKVGRVEVLRCRHCGHGISMPPLPDPSFLYEDRESQDYQPDSKGLSHAIKDLAFRRQAKKLLRQIGHRGGSILDFGCGSGQFTRILGEGANAKVIGADMHSEAPPELMPEQYLSPAELNGRRGMFDVVMAMHVLEHDDDADTLINQIASYARSGGKVVIEVPNVDCIWARPFGKYWDAWYLPYHRQHFTQASLVKLMEQNGLKIEAVHGITVPTMGRSFANIFGKRNNLFWLAVGIVSHPIQLLGEAVTGRRTAIRVVATRTG